MPNARSDESELWLQYQHNQRLDDSRRIFGSLRHRDTAAAGDSVVAPQRTDARGGLTFDVREWYRLEFGGGAYFTADPTGNDVVELRSWQAATFDWPEVHGLRRYVFHHRLMFEQRFKNTNDWRMSLRGRYRLSLALPLNRYTVESQAVYVPLSVEGFADIGPELPDVFAETARMTAGLGYVLSPRWTIELRYTREFRRDLPDTGFDDDGEIIELRFKSAVGIFDLLKAR